MLTATRQTASFLPRIDLIGKLSIVIPDGTDNHRLREPLAISRRKTAPTRLGAEQTQEKKEADMIDLYYWTAPNGKKVTLRRQATIRAAVPVSQIDPQETGAMERHNVVTGAFHRNRRWAI
jgi:hypothetical protein